MAFDSSKPAANSPILASELRNQFNGLQNNIQAKAAEDDCVSRFNQCAVKPTTVEGLGLVASPTYAPEQLQALADKLDELIAVSKGA
jgi:hypothetical protein